LAESSPARATLGGPPEEAGLLRTLLVALAVCGVCAALLTTSVVVLRPLKIENQQRERERRVRALVASLPGVGPLMEQAGAARLEVRAVELATGDYAPSLDPEALLPWAEEKAAAVPLASERDTAGIERVPRYAPVYLLRRHDEIHTVILPVRGRGYMSMMYGYLAVAGDGDTIRGITFTQHEETPGLGAEIENPEWQALWQGRRLRDEDGRLRIRVVTRAPAADAPEAAHEVQGIAGATKTGDGVTALVRFWVGPDGFGPFLEQLRAGEGR
jgi:Na+-transporting NADH:ubiquinone oxidoreductase subunit C